MFCGTCVAIEAYMSFPRTNIVNELSKLLTHQHTSPRAHVVHNQKNCKFALCNVKDVLVHPNEWGRYWAKLVTI